MLFSFLLKLFFLSSSEANQINTFFIEDINIPYINSPNNSYQPIKDKFLEALKSKNSKTINNLLEDRNGIFFDLSNQVLTHCLENKDLGLLKKFIEYSLDFIVQSSLLYDSGEIQSSFILSEKNQLPDDLYKEISNIIKDNEIFDLFKKYVFSCFSNKEYFIEEEFRSILKKGLIIKKDLNEFSENTRLTLFEKPTQNLEFAKKFYINALKDDKSYKNFTILSYLFESITDIQQEIEIDSNEKYYEYDELLGITYLKKKFSQDLTTIESPEDLDKTHKIFLPLDILYNHLSYAIQNEKDNSLNILLIFFKKFNIVIPENLKKDLENLKDANKENEDPNIEKITKKVKID